MGAVVMVGVGVLPRSLALQALRRASNARARALEDAIVGRIMATKRDGLSSRTCSSQSLLGGVRHGGNNKALSPLEVATSI